MELSDHVKEIQDGLRTAQFPNEASITQGIVLRVLGALGWPVYDTQVVWPEYAVAGRRVDLALCHPSRRKPLAFIEVKQDGREEGADRQLFEYAFHEGVPLAVLTTGREWHIYLPAEQGAYQERRVYRLDLSERDIEESVHRLTRYLGYDNVCSGKALRHTREDYQNVARDREIAQALPRAWQELLGESDNPLIDLFADKVESLCGYKPEAGVVKSFLAKELTSVGVVQTPAAPVAATPERTSVRRASTRPKAGARRAINQKTLIAHGVAEFVRVSGSQHLTARSTGDLLDAERIPHYFSKRAHEFAGCRGPGLCDKKSHGDEAAREVLSHLEMLAARGWCVRFTDGHTETVTVVGNWV